MKKIAALIVRARLPLMLAVLLCAALAAAAISRTTINYDLTSYLREDTDTMRGLKAMNEEFSATSGLSVVLTGASRETADAVAARIASVDGVLSAAHDPDTGLAVENGAENRLINVIMKAAREEETLSAVESLLEGTPHLLNSSVKDMRELRKSISAEMPVVMLVACAIVLGVLLFMSRSWLEPVIFLIVIGVSILLNMGTNWLFDSISFITFAVAAILQLALAMDYSIMLINAFDRLRDQGVAPREAMTEALYGTFMPICSSALTTVAGMISLVFMRFTIGFDIGIVLAKGIVMSMLTVFLLMPGLLTISEPLLRRTAHRPVRLGGRHLPKAGAAARGIVPILLILLIIAGAAVQTGNRYTYTVRDSDADSRAVSRLFGQENQVALLFPAGESDADYALQRELIRRVGEIQANGKPVMKSAYAMVTTGAQALEYYDAAKVSTLLNVSEGQVKLFFTLLGEGDSVRADTLIAKAASLAGGMAAMLPAGAADKLAALKAQLDLADETFNGERWARAILSLNIAMDDPEASRVLSDIKAVQRDLYGENAAITGMLVAMDDIATSFSGDVLRVSLITIIAVFLIVMISFRSLIIPLVLVCVIQGAIWLNMALSGLLDGSVFFMCYLICMALQMGATIDYGILLTDHYIACRRTMDKRAAIASAMDMSLQTILTSGLALIVAGFTVGAVSSVFYISSIGTMLGRGAVISVALILLLLPSLLLWLDRFIVRGNKQSKVQARG